ncbi:MAG: sigma-54 dependent transcriptional regulator [Thermodesulfobacteriota bacterium]
MKYKGVLLSEHGDAALLEELNATGGEFLSIAVASLADLENPAIAGDLQALFVRVHNGAEAGPVLAALGDVGWRIPRIVVADRAEADDVVAALGGGAGEFLIRPLAPPRLRLAMARVAGDGAESTGNDRKFPGFGGIIGDSPAMRQVFSLIQKVSDTDTTILIQGESGTGKELIARALHSMGGRAAGPFIPVNCGAIPGELLESELFGHEKGAFTHALNTRVGRFELANGGTVFLDEISEMSPMLQVKILRVLQERQFERVGGTKTISSDFRILAATNRNLEEEVAEGRFREDLFYRLNVIPIQAPPLRSRVGDILLLAEYFMDQFARRRKRQLQGFSPQARQLLLSYAWPGNVRELENIVERLIILAGGDTVGAEDLPEKMRQPSSQENGRQQDAAPTLVEGEFSLNDAVAGYEKRLLIQALNQTDWVKNRAAQLLGINRTTLIEKMKRHKLVKPQVRLED